MHLNKWTVTTQKRDGFLAESIHRALPLSRREAVGMGVFRYLALLRYPRLVRHRWEFRSLSSMRSRFWAPGCRHDSNAFSRWWWGAELTRDGDDYSLTSKVFARSALSTHLLNRKIADYRPALVAIVEELAPCTGPVIELTIKNPGKAAQCAGA